MKFIYVFMYLCIGCTPSRSNNSTEFSSEKGSSSEEDNLSPEATKTNSELTKLNAFLKEGHDLSFIVEQVSDDLIIQLRYMNFTARFMKKNGLKDIEDLSIDLRKKFTLEIQSEFSSEEFTKIMNLISIKSNLLILQTIYLAIFNKIESDNSLNVEFQEKFNDFLQKQSLKIKPLIADLELIKTSFKGEASNFMIFLSSLSTALNDQKKMNTSSIKLLFTMNP